MSYRSRLGQHIPSRIPEQPHWRPIYGHGSLPTKTFLTSIWVTTP